MREVWAVCQGQLLHGKWTTPLQAHPVGAESLINQRSFVQADRDAFLGDAEWGRELEVVRVAIVQRDDRIELPVFYAETIEGEGVMGFI